VNDKDAIWQKGIASRDWSGEFRGIAIRIKVDPKTGNPTSIGWYLDGPLDQTFPVTCDLEIAKTIALEVMDNQIARGGIWSRVSAKNEKTRKFARR
jgi:hypothetical protein